MDGRGFWQIIDDTHARSGGDIEAQVELLRERLVRLAPSDLLGFDGELRAATRDLFTWDLWGAAYLLLGGCGDDTFTDFRTWVVSRGRDTYLRVRSDAQALTDVPLSDEEEVGIAEELGYVHLEVYEQLTGRSVYDDRPADEPHPPTEPAGEPFDESDAALRARYPRLAVR